MCFLKAVDTVKYAYALKSDRPAFESQILCLFWLAYFPCLNGFWPGWFEILIKQCAQVSRFSQDVLSAQASLLPSTLQFSGTWWFCAAQVTVYSGGAWSFSLQGSSIWFEHTEEWEVNLAFNFRLGMWLCRRFPRVFHSANQLLVQCRSAQGWYELPLAVQFASGLGILMYCSFPTTVIQIKSDSSSKALSPVSKPRSYSRLEPSPGLPVTNIFYSVNRAKISVNVLFPCFP